MLTGKYKPHKLKGEEIAYVDQVRGSCVVVVGAGAMKGWDKGRSLWGWGEVQATQAQGGEEVGRGGAAKEEGLRDAGCGG